MKNTRNYVSPAALIEAERRNIICTSEPVTEPRQLNKGSITGVGVQLTVEGGDELLSIFD